MPEKKNVAFSGYALEHGTVVTTDKIICSDLVYQKITLKK